MRRLLLLSVALATPAFADDQPIIVLGRGLPDTPSVPAYDVTTLGRDDLTSAASGRIEDALSSVAGFQQFRRSDSRAANPSAQGVTLRSLGGNATSRTLVLLDGVPMADPFFGFVPLSALAPERLASARVTRGGGSGAFGSGAVAGTIELTSAGAAELGLLNAGALVNDRGETELSGTIAPQLGEGFAVLTGRWDRGQGFWTTPEAQRVPASVRARYDSWSAGLRAVTPIAPDVELQVRGLLFADARTLRFAGADTTARGEDASVRIVGRGNWQFDALAYVQARDFTNIAISPTTFRPTLNQYGTPATGAGGKLELRPPVGGSHVLRMGSDLRLATGRTEEVATNPNSGAVTTRRQAGGRQTDVGIYVEDDWKLDSLVLTFGARADYWRQSGGFLHEVDAKGIATDTPYDPNSGWQATWRAGAAWKPVNSLTLRSAAYTGLRLPTLNELYRPFSVGSVLTRANALLANEELRGFEAGIDWTPAPSARISVTAFDDKVKNAVANVSLSPTLRERRNVDAVHARGVELSARLQAGQVSFDGSLAWTDAKVEASGASFKLNGMRPAQTPKLAASATLGWTPHKGWNLALTLRHTGAQYEDDLQTDVLPAATTLNAYAAVPLGRRVTLVLRGENLTDTVVVTRNQGGSMDYGAPRTVWAGVKVAIY